MSMLPDVAGRRPEIGAFLDALFACLAESTAGRASDQAFVAGLAARVAEPGATLRKFSAICMARLRGSPRPRPPSAA
jgi:hypothetical protein